jgi:hypothetical protein
MLRAAAAGGATRALGTAAPQTSFNAQSIATSEGGRQRAFTEAGKISPSWLMLTTFETVGEDLRYADGISQPNVVLAQQ